METILPERVDFVSSDTILAGCDAWVNYSNTVLVECSSENCIRVRYRVFSETAKLTIRQNVIIEYIDRLVNHHSDRSALEVVGGRVKFAFQGDDCPTDATTVSWQTKTTFRNVCLVPDFYYARSGGYQTFLTDGVRRWADRLDCAFWRGSTTGGYGITRKSLYGLLRFQLCDLGLKLGSAADFGFVSVVQAKSSNDTADIRDHLIQLGLFKLYTEVEDYTSYKYIVQIDGNGNSWELVKKLRLGSCILLVESNWLLWHNNLLIAWVHFVPVKADLSDLPEKLDWCKANDERCSEIAAAGRSFALAIDFGAEMTDAFRAICRHGCPI